MTHFELNRAAAIDNFTSRTIGALNKIAEEHWKRQMKQEEEEEKLVSNTISLVKCSSRSGSPFLFLNLCYDCGLCGDLH